MKVLLDECIDHRLSRDLSGHEVSTIARMGWRGKENGELLSLAAAQFDVFLTTDRNLSYQQNLGRFDISIIVLEARSNRLAELRRFVPAVLRLLPFMRRGEIRSISI